MIREHLRVLSASALLLGIACSSPRSGTAHDSASDSTDARTRIAQLEAAARSLAKTTGCSSVDQCRTAPVGSRPCGGPRTFIAYCAASTDSVALFRKLDELREAEERFNESAGLASTCEMRMPSVPVLSGGSCSAP
jgi:hypothetical protein